MNKVKLYLMTMVSLMICLTATPVWAADTQPTGQDIPEPTFGSEDDPVSFTVRGRMNIIMPTADAGLGVGLVLASRVNDHFYVGLDVDLLGALFNQHAPNMVIGGGSGPSKWDPSFSFGGRGCMGFWVHELIALEVGFGGSVYNIGSDNNPETQYLMGDFSASACAGHVNLGVGILFGAQMTGEEPAFAGGLHMFFGYSF